MTVMLVVELLGVAKGRMVLGGVQPGHRVIVLLVLALNGRRSGPQLVVRVLGMGGRVASHIQRGVHRLAKGVVQNLPSVGSATR